MQLEVHVLIVIALQRSIDLYMDHDSIYQIDNEPHDDQYYLEMFHRAMANHEPDAWELLQQCFSPLVRAWMRNYPQRNLACRYELEENYVATTLTRV